MHLDHSLPTKKEGDFFPWTKKNYTCSWSLIQKNMEWDAVMNSDSLFHVINRKKWMLMLILQLVCNLQTKIMINLMFNNSLSPWWIQVSPVLRGQNSYQGLQSLLAWTHAPINPTKQVFSMILHTREVRFPVVIGELWHLCNHICRKTLIKCICNIIKE